MNDESHKRALGVDEDRQFLARNFTVNAAFYDNGQAMLNSARLLPELIDDGVRVMAMAGDVGEDRVTYTPSSLHSRTDGQMECATTWSGFRKWTAIEVF